MTSQSDKLELLQKIMSAEIPTNTAYEEFHQLLNHDYKQYLKSDDALFDVVDSYMNLLDVDKDIASYLRNEEVYSRHLVAMCGAFSSGKSAFINSLFEKDELKLPIDINPSTAIPAYVIRGKKKISGITKDGGRIELDAEQCSVLDHDYLRDLGFNLNALMPSIIVQTELPEEYEHICFVDTPGYNPGRSANGFTHQDKALALKLANQAQSLIWAISVKAGTVTNSDLSFLMEILEANPEKKIYFVCNKVDLVADCDVDAIMKQIEDTLDQYYIPYEGISAYSSRKKAEKTFLKKSLKDFFAEINKPRCEKKNELIQKINSTFIRHVNADAIRVQKLNRFKKNINEMYLAFSETSLDYSNVINHMQNKLRVHALKLGVEEPKMPELKNKHNEDYIRQGLSSIMGYYNSEVAQYEKNKRVALDLKKKFKVLCAKIFKDSEDKLAGYIHLNGGTFTMGNDKGPSDQRPEHQVTIAPFYMKSTPVTQREWREVMGVAYKHCSHVGDNLPVEYVSFIDAVAYCNAISQSYGLKPCYKYNSKTNDVSIDYSANGFRLPTEAEWEYAAKTVEESELFDRAWYSENSGDSTQAVAGRYENQYGLYDMLGNVYEWVNDYYASSYQFAEINPHGPSKGKQRVVRGGCYNSNPEVCTATARNSLNPKDNRLCVGFRPVLNDCNLDAFPFKHSIWGKIKSFFNS